MGNHQRHYFIERFDTWQPFLAIDARKLVEDKTEEPLEFLLPGAKYKLLAAQVAKPSDMSEIYPKMLYPLVN